MKSVPFRKVVKIPHDVYEGAELKFNDGWLYKISKIKSVKFLDMRTIEVIGLCKPIKEDVK